MTRVKQSFCTVFFSRHPGNISLSWLNSLYKRGSTGLRWKLKWQIWVIFVSNAVAGTKCGKRKERMRGKWNVGWSSGPIVDVPSSVNVGYWFRLWFVLYGRLYGLKRIKKELNFVVVQNEKILESILMIDRDYFLTWRISRKEIEGNGRS